MYKKLLLRFCTWLLKFTYEAVTLDTINKKLIRPVDGLIIDGVQYYEFVSVSDMPEARMVHYNHLRNELHMNMKVEQALQYLDQMERANDAGNTSLNGSLIYMMRDIIKNCTPIEVLYNLAALIYFDKSEDLGCFDGDYNARKIALFKGLPNQNFFLTRLLQRGLRTATGESGNDIDQYLNKSQVKLRAYAQILSEVKESQTLNDLSELS